MAGARIFLVVIVCSSAIYITNATKCGLGGPEVRSPFSLINKQPRDDALGRPGYELKCSTGDSKTMIGFPSYGDLVVKSIDYETKRIDLIDPKSCIHEVFLNLDLANTPFRRFYSLENFTYLNCSSSPPVDPILRSYEAIPCMSGRFHKVYTVDVSIGIPTNCRAIKTVAIPFGYSHYISDNTFGLALTWDSPPCDGCSDPVADHFHQHHQVLGWSIIFLLCACLAVSGLVAVNVHSSYIKKQGDLNNKEDEGLLQHNDGVLISQEA